jgi:hypothetical protein
MHAELPFVPVLQDTGRVTGYKPVGVALQSIQEGMGDDGAWQSTPVLGG